MSTGAEDYKLKMLVLIILTNLVTICIFTAGPSFNLHQISNYARQYFSLPGLCESTATAATLLHQLKATQAELAATLSQVFDLHRQLISTNSLLEALLTELSRLRQLTGSPTHSGFSGEHPIDQSSRSANNGAVLGLPADDLFF